MSNYEVMIKDSEDLMQIDRENTIGDFVPFELDPGVSYSFPNSFYRIRVMYLSVSEGKIIADTTHVNMKTRIVTGSCSLELSKVAQTTPYQMLTMKNCTTQHFKVLLQNSVVYLVCINQPSYDYTNRLEDRDILSIIDDMFPDDYVSNGKEVILK